MTSPRNIAPARPPTAPANPAPSATQSASSPQPVGANDVIFVNGQPFNGRGYPVCGIANQRGRLCGRIGTCPFHAKQKAATPKRPRSPNRSSDASSHPPDPKRPNPNLTVRQMAMPPQKARFKRSWTTEEHRIFLQAMRRYGKGKWKEIASEVKTRTANQCQSHAQKYFLRQAKSDSERKKKSIHDVTETDVLEDSTWNSLQTAARQALAAQQQQNHQKPSSAQTIAPAPVQPAHLPNPTSQLNTVFPPSSIPAITSSPSQHHSSAKVALHNAAVSSTSPLPNGNHTIQSQQEPTKTSAIPTVNITVPADSSSQLAALASSHPVVSSNSLPVVQGQSSMSTVPVVVSVPGVGIRYAPLVSSFLPQGLSNPSSAAIVTPPPPAKTRVTVHVNGRLKGGMALMLPNGLDKFFEMAKSKLHFAGNFGRVFTRSGGEITSVDEMCQDDMLWLSTGEDFLTPR